MEKPGVGGSWLDKLFGWNKKTTPDKPKPVPIPGSRVPSRPSTSSRSRQLTFSTTYSRNNATMLSQLRAANKYRSLIEQAARRYGFQVAVICGIGSRESHWGLALKPPGTGGRGDFARRRPRGKRRTATPPDGPGYGRGLMQIDYDWHEFARTGKWYSARENILYACALLEKNRLFFERKGLSLNQEQLLRAVLAAYNAGATATLGAIQAGKGIDSRTTGRDYSKDVLNRSGWFQLQGW